MGHRFQSKEKHLPFIRSLPCAIGRFCQGSIEAHHLMRPWDGERGMGMRSNDRNAIPLCSMHHRKLHLTGDEDKFWMQEDFHEDYGRELSKMLWEKNQLLGDGLFEN